ncbi:MAG: radical SAM protein [Candidatus Omnitrophica bacterium]|nr:radical SAM protein [Candidatus Omnitrophota bacterium]
MLRSMCSQLNNLISFRKLFSFRQVMSGVRYFPATVNFLITNKCNLNCSICSAHGMLDNSQQLSAKEIVGFIKKISRYKPAIFFGGGEPFIRKDIFEILAATKKNGLKYGIVTNGTMLDEHNIKRLFDFAPEIIIFSVHGDEISHDAKTGKKGAFVALYKAIKLAVKHKKKTDILLNAVITQDNYLDLEKIVVLGKELGVNRVRFENLIFLSELEYAQHLAGCVGVLKEKQAEMTTYIKDINCPKIGPDMQKEVLRLKQKYGSFVIFKPYMTDHERSRWFEQGFKFNRKCMFVRHSVFIRPNGDIIPCQFFSNYKLGNIKTDDLSRVWQEEKRKKFTKILNKEILPGCMRCCKL